MKWDESKHPRGDDGRFIFAYEAIKSRMLKIPLNFFNERGLKDKRSIELRRGIRKTRRRLLEHKAKLENPQKHCHDWESRSDAAKAGLLDFWRKEIRTKQNAIKERLDILRERGEDTSEFDN